MKLRLTIDVEYADNGVTAGWLKENLRQLADRAVGEGMLTGASEAEVERWEAKVADVSDNVGMNLSQEVGRGADRALQEETVNDRKRIGICALQTAVDLAQKVLEKGNLSRNLTSKAECFLAEYDDLTDRDGECSGEIEDAKGEYFDECIYSFDDYPMVSKGEDGCNVNVWVWVPYRNQEEEQE